MYFVEEIKLLAILKKKRYKIKIRAKFDNMIQLLGDSNAHYNQVLMGLDNGLDKLQRIKKAYAP